MCDIELLQIFQQDDLIDNIIEKWETLHQDKISTHHKILLFDILLLVEHKFRLQNSWHRSVAVMLLHIDMFLHFYDNTLTAESYFKSIAKLPTLKHWPSFLD